MNRIPKRFSLRGQTLFFLYFFLILIYSQGVKAGDPNPEERNGSIRGRVFTSDDRPAAGVSVTVVSTDMGRITDEKGEFVIGKLKPGSYTLSISLTSYQTLEQVVVVEQNKTTSVAFKLKISENELQQVIVSAARNPYSHRQVSASLRLNEPILETPQNIQVITSKTLSDQQVISMSDGVLRNVSGATRLAHWADLYTNVQARGSQMTALRNGMSIATSYWSPLTEDMSVVDHVEFVKGPAGFLMPVGDPAGIYNTVTKKPTGNTRGEAGFTMGSYDLYRATLDLDGKLDKEGKLLYRFNAAGKAQNSFRTYDFNNRLTIAPVLSYKLDENTTLTAEYLYQKAKMSDMGSYYVFSTKGYAGLPRNFTSSDPGLDPTNITDQSLTLNLQKQLSPQWKLTVQAAYMDYKQVGSNLWPSLVTADSMIRGVGIWDASSTAKFGQAYLNGEVQTGGVHHRIIAGLDINDKEYLADWNQSHNLDTDEQKFSLLNPVYGNPSNGYAVFDRTKPLSQRAGIYGTQALSYSGLYLQDELGFFNNKLRLTLAGRYSYAKTNDYNSIAVSKKITPRVGLSYSIDESTSVYGLFDQAFVPQSGIRQDHKTVKPLTGSNLEAGIKKDWMNGRLSATLSGYKIIRNNANSPDPSDPSGRYIVQLGQTTSKGVEFDVRGEVLPGLTLTANYAYTDAKITKTDTSDASKATLGQKVPGYSTHVANAWVNYQFKRGALKGLGLSAGITYMKDRNEWEWSSSATPLALPDYSKIDAGIFWEQNALRITLNVFNVADKYLYSGAAYGDYYYWQAESPRNWRLGMAYKF